MEWEECCKDGSEPSWVIDSSGLCAMDVHQHRPKWPLEFHKGLYWDPCCSWCTPSSLQMTVQSISSLKHCWLHPPTHTYRMNVTLEWVDSFKYPGVRIDSKLKWGARYRLTATFKFMCKVLRDLARQFSFVWNAMALHLLSCKITTVPELFSDHSKMKANIRLWKYTLNGICW